MSEILLLINQMSDHPTEDESDVMVQAEAVEQALDELGWKHHREYFSLNLSNILTILENNPPEKVFNLVESVAGKGALIQLCPSLLEAYRIPFTGSGAYSLAITTDKVRTKKILAENNIPTPSWLLPGNDFIPSSEEQFIIKPIWEDGSAGITDDSIVQGDFLKDEGKRKELKIKGCFLEAFIQGREFNLSVIAGEGGPIVLPVAEMQYIDYPAGKPKILNYASKWDPDSIEYHKTIRTFDIPEKDKTLIGKMVHITRQCWDIFEIKGYVRVDFRVDEQNNPYVLEVNANPCLSPDAGFPATCLAGGINYTQMIERILTDVRL